MIVVLPTVLSFAFASLIIELTPGPNMTYLALVAASDGRRAGFATVAGVALGLATIGLAAAFGVAQLVSASPIAYEILRWAGVLFLLYLAWDGWRGEGDVVAVASNSDGRYFRRGLITNLLNPKAAVFYVVCYSTRGTIMLGRGTVLDMPLWTRIHDSIRFLTDPSEEPTAAAGQENRSGAGRFQEGDLTSEGLKWVSHEDARADLNVRS